MIAPQPPPPPIFVSLQAMADADMAAQHLALVAAIETNYIVMAYRLSHRHGGSSDLFRLAPLAKLTDSPVDRRDEIGKLIGGQLMMTDVAPDYPCCEKRVIDSGFHEHRPAKSWNKYIPPT
jgi:hypothetical protein